MSNLDLTISDIFYGDTAVLKVMKGDEQKWPNALPLLYDAQVEYLQGDETAYIDTGISMREKTTAVMKVAVPFTPSETRIFYGAYMDRLTTPKSQIGVTNATKWLLGNFTALGATNNGTITLDTIYTISLSYNGVSSNRTLYVFARNNDINAYIPCAVKIYSLVMISDGVLVRDYIPVRVGQVGYLYDKVSGQLFGNAAASGAFTYGNDV